MDSWNVQVQVLARIYNLRACITQGIAGPIRDGTAASCAHRAVIESVLGVCPEGGGGLALAETTRSVT